MGLFEKWCDSTKESDNRKCYWTYTERVGARDDVLKDVATVIRSHYGRLEHIAEDVERLGYEQAADILRQQMPQTPINRSGDLGEILATELVEEEVGLRVPVRRLRYKDGRDLPMRGDDFIGASFDESTQTLSLLKGEAKSRKVLGKRTVEEAREVLNRDSGRCTPGSLMFVANCLLESSDTDDNQLGRRLRDEVGQKLLSAEQITHMLFTLSGNGAPASLRDDFESVSTDRNHYIVNIHIRDHQDFIAAMYEEAENLGDD